MERKYLTNDLEILTNDKMMKDYVQKGIDQKLEMHFDSATIPQTYKNITKLCGSDFDHFIHKSNMAKSKLVLIQNPDHSKNLDIDK